MRATSLAILVAIIFISCKSSDEPKQLSYRGFTDKEIYLIGRDTSWELKDSLGMISLKIPTRFDTFYYWHHESDCSSCGWMKYRFSHKSYPQFAEDGWYWTFIPDSVYQLNIWHKPIKEAPDSITLKPLREKDTVGWYYHPHFVNSSKPANFLLKEFTIINERPFIISAFITSWGYLTHTQTLYIIAETNLKSRELYFIGECSSKDTTGFIDNMYKSFLSIKIEEKQ